jgi:hypothetical protein
MAKSKRSRFLDTKKKAFLVVEKQTFIMTLILFFFIKINMNIMSAHHDSNQKGSFSK